MPVLDNPRHERFAQELAKGKSQEQAYEDAGYKRNRACAARLASDANICERVRELCERNAARIELNAQALIDMLLEDRKLAHDLEQVSASVSALDKVARIMGAYAAERRELSGPNGGPIATDATPNLTELLRDAPPDVREWLRKSLEK